MGIEYEEAVKMLTDKLDASMAAADLRTIKQAHRASAKAYRLLEKIADDGAVYTGTGESVQFPNLAAAKALLDYSLKAQRLAKIGRAQRMKEKAAAAQRDLFDGTISVEGPWQLRKLDSETEDEINSEESETWKDLHEPTPDE